MAEQYSNITWSFNLNDRGTHSGNYFDKLNQLVSGFNLVIDGVNAQLIASEDAEAIRNDIINIRDVDITAFRDQMVALRDEAIEIRDATNAIASAEINGLSVDFLSAKVQGVNVVTEDITVNGHPLDGPIVLSPANIGLDEVDNTNDADKPVSTATQNAIDNVINTTTTRADEIEIFALAGMVM